MILKLPWGPPGFAGGGSRRLTLGKKLRNHIRSSSSGVFLGLGLVSSEAWEALEQPQVKGVLVGAGKGFGEARDLGRIFGDIGRFRATETALSRVSGAKAPGS
jgi:hypothetical protein